MVSRGKMLLRLNRQCKLNRQQDDQYILHRAQEPNENKISDGYRDRAANASSERSK